MSNIYLVERTDGCSYDEYDSFVVIAKTEKEAREIHPRGHKVGVCSYTGKPEPHPLFDSWVKVDEIDSLDVTLVGKAAKGQKPGIVLSSFNAG